MMHAAREIMKHIGDREVEYVKIIYCKYYSAVPLRLEGGLKDVLPMLEFEYGGHGSQELNGYIWYTDGTWSNRGEYDGTEWRQYQSRPDHNVDVEVRGGQYDNA